jgi:deoxyribose-phosphate aldolase
MELPLLAPELTEEHIALGVDAAKQQALSTVTVRPSDLDTAARWTGASIILGAAIDWPHGFSTPAVKQYAVRDALRRGAKEITIPMNTGKLISRQFQYLEMELVQIAEACHEAGALLTVNLETERLTEEHKIVACRVSKRAGVDFLATTDISDIAFLAPYTRERIQLKLRDAGSIDAVLEALAGGCARIESPHAIEILEAWKSRVVPAATHNHV